VVFIIILICFFVISIQHLTTTPLYYKCLSY